MDALLRRREMIASGDFSIIPFIRGGADGSYIDTGITPDQTTRVIVLARNFNQGVDNNWLFGARPSSGDAHIDVVAGRYGHTGGLAGMFGSSATWHDNAWPYFSHYHKYELSADGFFVDDTQLTSPSSSGAFSLSENIHLFGYNAGGTNSGSLLPVDICACKIYKNDVLVRDYTPVTSSSVVGFYDAVSGTVFTNAGSGSFTYGTFNQNAYTPLEYITTSGASALITPAIGSYSLPIVTMFHPTGTNAAWFMPLGARSQDTKRCDIITGNTTYSNARLYSLLGDGEDATAMYTSRTAGATRKDLVVVKKDNTFTAYYNNAAFGSSATFNVSTSYSTGARIGIGAQFLDYPGNPQYGAYFVGNIYYVGLGDYNLVPAKVGGVAGMYDTYNDTFYPSTTSTPFTAGPEI